MPKLSEYVGPTSFMFADDDYRHIEAALGLEQPDVEFRARIDTCYFLTVERIEREGQLRRGRTRSKVQAIRDAAGRLADLHEGAYSADGDHAVGLISDRLEDIRDDYNFDPVDPFYATAKAVRKSRVITPRHTSQTECP